MSDVISIYTWMLPPVYDLGIKYVFQSQPGFIYQGAYDTLDALSDALGKEDSQLDLLIMDYEQGFTGYPKLLSTLRQTNDQLRVLFLLPGSLDGSLLVHALRSGGDGYLLNRVTHQVLLDAVDEIINGRSYIDSQMTPRVLEELRKPGQAMEDWDVHTQLTDREKMLVQLAADGLSNVQIGQVLGLAEKTIRNHWSTLFDKIGFGDRTQAVLWAIRTGQAELR